MLIGNTEVQEEVTHLGFKESLEMSATKLEY